MNYTLPFEKYENYRLAVDLSLKIYEVTQDWPSDEKFRMISQVRRASTSIGENIAEGISRFSEKEKERFLEVAFGSLMEVAHFLSKAKKLAFIPKEELDIKKQSLIN